VQAVPRDPEVGLRGVVVVEAVLRVAEEAEREARKIPSPSVEALLRPVDPPVARGAPRGKKVQRGVVHERAGPRAADDDDLRRVGEAAVGGG